MISINPRLKYAIWAGRFQPFHIGHMSFLKQICTKFEGQIIIAVIASSPRAAVDSYSKEANAQHQPKKNPLTIWERLTMIRLALEAEGLSDRVIAMGIPRPDANWDIVKSFYPPKRVLFFSNRNSFETMKVNHWLEAGESVQVIEVETGMSGTEFKERVRSGEDWRPYLLEATVEYFTAIDGPSRFAVAD